jgi:hypothetical protein
MFESILFVATIFMTRIILPVVVTWLIGSLIERALNHRIQVVV